MIRIATLAPLALALALAAPVPAAGLRAAAAEESGSGDLREGLELLERGADIILRRLMEEVEPLARELAKLIDDLNAYHPPEMLPNGDIILRRKVPLAVEPPAEGGVDL